MEAVAVLSPGCLRALANIRYAEVLQVQYAICLACSPAVKRLLRAVKYRKQHAALTLSFHSRTALLASSFRKKFAAYIIGLRIKSKRLLPVYLDNPIRVAFTQKSQFQGTLEKKVREILLDNAGASCSSSGNYVMLFGRLISCVGTSVSFA